MIETETTKVKTVFFKSFYGDENAFAQATEWVNGEGGDFTVSCGKTEKQISLSFEEQSALQVIINAMNVDIINSKGTK